QLTLKEGLTNFRDQTFAGDMTDRGVQRIEDAATLRAVQFVSDAGPLAHPIRPSEVESPENFYTTTIYEKGAEVIRMMRTMMGYEKFREAMNLYFKRHDGQAVTTEDFVAAMADTSGIDLTQFERTWYNQAGTPVLDITDAYDADADEYTLTIKQHTPATPGQPTKEPFHIPVQVGLLDSKGHDMQLNLKGDASRLTNGDVLHVRKPEETFVFTGVKEKPLPSLLRDFSAPVKVNYDYSRDDLMFLLSHDSDGFNRWDAGQKLAIEVIKDQVEAIQGGKTEMVDRRLVDAYKAVLEDASISPLLKAEFLTLPSRSYIMSLYPVGEVDVDAIHDARERVRIALATKLEPQFKEAYDHHRESESRPYAYNMKDMGERRIKLLALAYLMAVKGEHNYLEQAKAQLEADRNMTEVSTALWAIANYGNEAERAEAFGDFYEAWKADPLMMNQWLAIQATADRDDVLKDVKALTKHPAYDPMNPNSLRSLVGAFSHTVHFHAKDGEGYTFLADEVIRVDKFNPDVASRLVEPLTEAYKFPQDRRALMKVQLERIAAYEGLSKNTREKVSKSLKLLESDA
ncbi:MAG: DUF3458 domain-containing protein, partial [Rickettsiales bacterium]